MNARDRRLLEDLRAYVVPSAQSEGFASHSGRLLTRLDVALKVEASPKKSAAKRERRRAKTSKREAKSAETARIREFVFARSGGLCECCGNALSMVTGGELDHARGRGRAPQSVFNTWMLAPSCHRRRTNGPAEEWLERYIKHSRKHGHYLEAEWAESRLAFVLARSSGAETAGSAR